MATGTRRSVRMSRSKFVSLAIVIVSMLLIGTSTGFAQPVTTTSPNPANPLKVTGTLPTTPLPPPDLNGPIQMQSIPVPPQSPPRGSVPPSAANQFEHHSDFLNLPRIFAHQWSPTKEVVPDNVISERYMRSEDPQRARPHAEGSHLHRDPEQSVVEGVRTRSDRLDGNRARGQRYLRSQPYRAG